MKRAFGGFPMAMLRTCLADCTLAAEQQYLEALLVAIESLPHWSPGAKQMPEFALALTQVELVEPPEGSAPGERVTAEGFDGEPEEQLNPKKKIFEQIQPELQTNAERVACYRNLPLKTQLGVCKVSSIVGGSIK